jgi:AraC family transcriptional regulator of adaptative response/methylated-DNA-[protein]-cysteine methyltransferase
MSDYERIAAVIRHLDGNHVSQPSVSELAGAAGLSISHFHRLFKRWAGVTPKDFLQCVTLEHARSRLHASRSVLDAALDAGLSGPGRLHDLFVSIEAASPGEVKSGGAGMQVEWGFAESPFGMCSVGWGRRGVCHLAFHDRASGFPDALRGRWPNAHFVRNNQAAKKWIGKIFVKRTGDRIPAFLRGTAFQLKVWRALLLIPGGSVTTYSRIASAIGNPGALRAVGSACGANPVAWLIPCHRVIRETGVVSGYRWGNERKRSMLAMEGFDTGAKKSGAGIFPAPLEGILSGL